ncbi:MAG: sugar phosphate isomerase/epimerase [Eubacteriales bacterium]
MKSCISTYSFSRMFQKAGWTLFDAIDKTKELGADGVEFVLGDETPTGETLSDYAKRLASHAREKGLSTPIYTTGADFLYRDADSEVERLKAHIDAAADAGITLLRHDIAAAFPKDYSGPKTFEAVFKVIPPIRRVAEYALSKGVTTCSENHGRLVQDSERMHAIFSMVDHPNYKYLCDIGNFGGVDEDCAVAVSKLLPFVVHVHAKDCFWRSGMLPNPGFGWSRTRGGDYRRATIYGQGDVPTLKCLSIIYNSGYRGEVSLEFEGIEDCLTAIEVSLANLKRDISLIKSGF